MYYLRQYHKQWGSKSNLSALCKELSNFVSFPRFWSEAEIFYRQVQSQRKSSEVNLWVSSLKQYLQRNHAIWKDQVLMLGSNPRSVAIVANLRVPVTFQHLPTVLVNNPCQTVVWVWKPFDGSENPPKVWLSSSSKSLKEKTSLSIFATTMSSQLEPSLWFTFLFTSGYPSRKTKNTAAPSAACRWGRFSCSHTQPVLLLSQVLRASSRLTRELEDFFSTRLNTDYSSLRTAVMSFFDIFNDLCGTADSWVRTLSLITVATKRQLELNPQIFRHPVNPANSSRLLAVQLGHKLMQHVNMSLKNHTLFFNKTS